MYSIRDGLEYSGTSMNSNFVARYGSCASLENIDRGIEKA